MEEGITTIDPAVWSSTLTLSRGIISNGSSQGIPSLVRFVGADRLVLEAADKEVI
jgi:hypothetical protein